MRTKDDLLKDEEMMESADMIATTYLISDGDIGTLSTYINRYNQINPKKKQEVIDVLVELSCLVKGLEGFVDPGVDKVREVISHLYKLKFPNPLGFGPVRELKSLAEDYNRAYLREHPEIEGNLY